MKKLSKNLKHILRAAILYAKYHKEIDQLYGYNIKHGQVNEDANWIERTYFWLMTE
jgi:hypothetical protein